jgi:hypothetical protein
MRPETQKAMADAVVTAIAAATERITRAFGVRLKEQSERIVVLESKLGQLQEAQAKSMHYAGVYAEGMRYEPGAVVTAHGSMWLALKSTSSRPGSDPDSWRLTMKAHR